MTQVLKQGKNIPFDLASEVAVIWAATNGYLDNLPVDRIEVFENKLLNNLKTRGKSLTERINKNKMLDKKVENELKNFVSDSIESI